MILQLRTRLSLIKGGQPGPVLVCACCEKRCVPLRCAICADCGRVAHIDTGGKCGDYDEGKFYCDNCLARYWLYGEESDPEEVQS